MLPILRLHARGVSLELIGVDPAGLGDAAGQVLHERRLTVDGPAGAGARVGTAGLLSVGDDGLLDEVLEESLAEVLGRRHDDDDVGELLPIGLDGCLDLFLLAALGAGVDGVVDHPAGEDGVRRYQHGIEGLRLVLELGGRLQLGLDLSKGEVGDRLVSLVVHEHPFAHSATLPFTQLHWMSVCIPEHTK